MHCPHKLVGYKLLNLINKYVLKHDESCEKISQEKASCVKRKNDNLPTYTFEFNFNVK